MDDAEYPTAHREPAMRERAIAVAYGGLVALLLHQYLRSSGPHAAFQLIQHGDLDAGALAIAGATLVAAALQLLLLWRIPQLGHAGLVGMTLLLFGILWSWRLFRSVLDTPIVMVPIVLLCMLIAAIGFARVKGAHRAMIGPVATRVALIILIPIFLLAVGLSTMVLLDRFAE